MAITDIFGELFGTKPVAQTTDGNPRVDQPPLGASGRLNLGGFVSEDELNAALSGVRGLRRFDEIYRSDPDIRRNVLAVWSPVQAASYQVEPFGGDDATDTDREAADLCEWVLWDHMEPSFPAHLATLGPVLIRSGSCVFEQVWATATWEGKTVTVPRNLDLRLPRTIWRWLADEYGELQAIEQFLPNARNAVIPASEIVHYRVQAEGDNWAGTSLLRQAYKPWFYKDRLERIDAIGQERKAVGVPIVYPPQAASPETKGEVEKILASLHVNDTGYVIMPGPKAGTSGTDATEGWTVDVIKFDSSSGESIQKSIDAQQRKIAGAFLADFLELGHHQVGARATAQVQEDPFLTSVEALGEQILGPLNKLLDRITRLNFPNVKGTPKLKMSMHDTASLSEIATYVGQLVGSGAMQVDPDLEDYLRERADLPVANATVREERETAAKQAREMLPAAGEQRENELGEGPDATAQKALPPPRETSPPAKGAEKRLEQGDAKWWEAMLSHGKLTQALDTAKERVQIAGRPAAVRLAREMADRGRTGRRVAGSPPKELVDAIAGELERLHRVGHETVSDELANQRQTMQLAAPPRQRRGGLIGLARQRARVAAGHVTNQVARTVEQETLNGNRDTLALQRAAETTALAALRAEATANASASVNAGRTEAAREATDVVGGILTSVLDQNTCDECQVADDGVIRETDDPALQVPVPTCSGGLACRCMVVWLLSEDPAVVAAAQSGEGALTEEA